jgi:hypothetical protein
MHVALGVLLVALIGAGCDANRPPAEIELGTGGPNRFEDVSSGATLDLAQGCQGLQHVWLSVRVRGLDPARAVIEAQLTRARDAEMVALMLQVSLPLMPVDGGAEVTGLQIVVPNAQDVLNEDLVLSVRVTDRGGASAERSIPVRVEWGDERCEDAVPNPDAGATDATADVGDIDGSTDAGEGQPDAS